MTATAWVISGGRKRRIVVVLHQAASVAALALSFFRGATLRQMSGSFDGIMSLQIRRRLRRSAPHRSAGIAT